MGKRALRAPRRAGPLPAMNVLTRRAFVLALAALPIARIARAATPALALVAAARAQIGVTVAYDPAYESIPYPMGDVDRSKGVCTDVVIRAYRDALGIDLQALVHEDMRAAFAAYPKTWGLRRPDPNIDHRRVGNLRVFFARNGEAFAPSEAPGDYAPGDLVAQIVPPNLPHVAIVSDRTAADGLTPLILHNIGDGTREEDRLFEFEIVGRYRFGLDRQVL